MDWDRHPLKRLARINPSTLSDDTPPEQAIRYVDISNVQEGRVSAPEDMLFGNAPSRARRLVQNGDVILSTVRTYLRAVALVEDADRLIVSTGFAVLRPDAGLRSRFLWYVLRSESFVADVMRHSEGVSYPTIPPERLAALRIAVPPEGRQQEIADFLDRETAKIDTLLEERTRLVQLLQERLQAGIDSAIESMQLNGGTTKLKYLLARTPRNGISPRITESGRIPTFSTAAMVDGKIDIDEHVKYADASPEAVRECLVQRDDVLVLRGSGSKRLVGRAGIVTAHPPEGCVYPDILIRLQPLPSIGRRLLIEVINSGLCRHQIELHAKTASGIWKITGGDIGNLSVPLALRDRSNSTSNEVREARESFNRSAGQMQASMTVLREYRSALITAAVTGQIDVRHAS